MGASVLQGRKKQCYWHMLHVVTCLQAKYGACEGRMKKERVQKTIQKQKVTFFMPELVFLAKSATYCCLHHSLKVTSQEKSLLF